MTIITTEKTLAKSACQVLAWALNPHNSPLFSPYSLSGTRHHCTDEDTEAESLSLAQDHCKWEEVRGLRLGSVWLRTPPPTTIPTASGRELRSHRVPPPLHSPDGERDLLKVRPELSSMNFHQWCFHSIICLRICLDPGGGGGGLRGGSHFGFRDSFSNFFH